jgi:hypothetical protein
MIKDTRPVWRKSSHSGGDNGNCVEVNDTLNGVRDSKNPNGPVLKFHEIDLQAFIAGVKEGRYT